MVPLRSFLTRPTYVILSIILTTTTVFLIFYSPLKQHVLYQRKLGRAKVKAILLNHDLPPFAQLAVFMDDEQQNATFLRDFVDYYEKIFKIFPQAKEIDHLLGYFYFYLGDTQKAVVLFQQAVRSNPQSFWSYYDLGVIKMLEGNREQSLKYFQQASRVPPEAMRSTLLGSKPYQQIISAKSDPAYAGENLKSGYRQSYRMVCLLSYQKKNFKDMLSSAISAVKLQLDDHGDFLFFAGVASYEMKDIKSAVSFFQECLKKDPKSARAYLYLAKSFSYYGEEELASKANKAARAFDAQPDLLQVNPDELKVKIF